MMVEMVEMKKCKICDHFRSEPVELRESIYKRRSWNDEGMIPK